MRPRALAFAAALVVTLLPVTASRGRAADAPAPPHIGLQGFTQGPVEIAPGRHVANFEDPDGNELSVAGGA